MADVAPDELTWDIAVIVGGARRPSVNDVGGTAWEDEDPEPDTASMPYAAALNQQQKQIAAIGAVTDSARVSIHFTTGTPSVIGATGPGSATVPNLFSLTDNGTGDTTIIWPAGSLPSSTPGLQPSATVNAVGAFAICAVYVTNGVRVRTYTSSTGAAADADFTVNIE